MFKKTNLILRAILMMLVILLAVSLSFSALLGEPPEAADKPSKPQKSLKPAKTEKQEIKRIDTTEK